MKSVSWMFWLACFNSWFIVCKILYIIHFFTTNVINMLELSKISGLNENTDMTLP